MASFSSSNLYSIPELIRTLEAKMAFASKRNPNDDLWGKASKHLTLFGQKGGGLRRVIEFVIVSVTGERDGPGILDAHFEAPFLDP